MLVAVAVHYAASVNLVETALVSAGTAAVVTMLIEYTAKPYLEARKDRIVNASKDKRKLQATLSVVYAESPGLGNISGGAANRRHGHKKLEKVRDRCQSVMHDAISSRSAMGKRQHDILLQCIRLMMSGISDLENVVEIQEYAAEVGPDYGMKQKAVVDRTRMEAKVGKSYENFVDGLSFAMSCLLLKRSRPLGYFRETKKMDELVKRRQHSLGIPTAPADKTASPDAP